MSSKDKSKGNTGSLDEELPPALENARQDWMTTFQAYAVINGLFLGFQVTLLQLIKSSSDDPNITHHPGAFRALLFFTYTAVILNTVGVIVSMQLVHDLTAIPDVRRKRKQKGIPHYLHGLSDDKRTIEVLAEIVNDEGMFGFIWRFNSWILVTWTSPLSVGVQFLLYIFMHESYTIATPLAVVTFLCIFPLVRYPSVGRPERGRFLRQEVGERYRFALNRFLRNPIEV